jgi:hypothetical protein
MDETELFHQAGLPEDWVTKFVVESNKIDPQPGPDGPGTLIFEGHREAVVYAIRMASEDRYAPPNAVHRLLLRDHPAAEKLRSRDLKIGLNDILPATLVPHSLWKWNKSVHQVIDSLRVSDRSIDPDLKFDEICDLHCEFENIHPYELYNGKVGRILMVNHALLVDMDPWIVTCLKREDYLDMIRDHPSSEWGVNPPED